MNSKHRPRKRFGQHFLVEASIINQIIRSIHPQPGEHLVEIGPGEGVLTELLLPICDLLDVIEIDRDLAAHLKQHYPQLNIHNQDVLRFDFTSISHKPQSLRVVGNLPYNISTPLLFYLFGSINLVKDMHFMLQKEVVQRMCAPAGDTNYSRLSVMTQYYCDNQFLFEIPPSAFQPPPKVISAFVRMTPKSPLVEAKSLDLFGQIVKNAFTYRRKTLSNCLKGIIDAKSLSALGIDPKSRPQQLSVDDYVNISNFLVETNKGF